MMVKLLLPIILAFLISCSGLPDLGVTGSFAPIEKMEKSCFDPYPSKNWQFVHSIEASMSGDKTSFMLGVTIISPETGTVRCVMMTLEGFVLFEAVYDGKVIIKRAVPPFDSLGFARGLMDDIRLIFFKPEGLLTEAGIAGDGASRCRFKNKEGMVTDVLMKKDGGWGIRRYNRWSTLIRSVDAYDCEYRSDHAEVKVPGRLELIAHGSGGYSLRLELIEGELVN